MGHLSPAKTPTTGMCVSCNFLFCSHFISSFTLYQFCILHFIAVTERRLTCIRNVWQMQPWTSVSNINGFGEFGDKHGHFANNRPEMTSQRIFRRIVIIIVVNRYHGVITDQ